MSIGNKPVNPIPMTTYQDLGLTYREWLIGMLASNPAMYSRPEDSNFEEILTARVIRHADAIIKQLDKEEK